MERHTSGVIPGHAQTCQQLIFSTLFARWQGRCSLWLPVFSFVVVVVGRGCCRIYLLQVAERVAQERGESLGHSVGYQIRLDQ